jgi:Ni,Fe-hydrogenase III large subunit
MSELGKRESFTIPIGPQHPALKEPEHFLISVDGEIVTDAVVRLGYAHRSSGLATHIGESKKLWRVAPGCRACTCWSAYVGSAHIFTPWLIASVSSSSPV